MNQISLRLHPRWADDTVSELGIEIAVQMAECKPLLYPESGFGGRLPFAAYDRLQLCDDAGDVPFSIEEAPPYGPLINRHVRYEREIQGALRYSYTVYPRVVPEDFRSCPYFDFRSEKDGANGSGLLTLMLPDDDDTEYQLNIQWDLSDLPEGCTALYNIERYTQIPLQRVRFSFFMVGRMHSIASDSARFCWLSDPGFDIAAIGRRIADIYDYMKACFCDDDSNFLIFIRRDPFPKSGGGTACPYAFLSGYSALGTTDLDRWENVLVHEMTHTWPNMDGGVTGNPLTWYNEGMVEYLCAFLPYEGGFYTRDYLLQLINNKAGERYYGSKYRTLSEKEIEKVQWSDMSAQATPYGRGFMYIAMVDYQLKKLGRSLGDVIIGRYKGKLTEQNWLDFIQDAFGEKGVKAYHAMLDGQLIIPPEDLFEGFKTEAFETEIDGEQTVSYRWTIA